jgi:hypothetical protein
MERNDAGENCKSKSDVEKETVIDLEPGEPSHYLRDKTTKHAGLGWKDKLEDALASFVVTLILAVEFVD